MMRLASISTSRRMMSRPKPRLLGVGAVQVAQWLECRVLRAPGGHLLCVIPVHSELGVFEAGATTWP